MVCPTKNIVLISHLCYVSSIFEQGMISHLVIVKDKTIFNQNKVIVLNSFPMAFVKIRTQFQFVANWNYCLSFLSKLAIVLFSWLLNHFLDAVRLYQYHARHPCSTCHMALSFLPLSRTTKTTICSSSNLLVATFTQHLASHPTSGSLLTTSSPLPSPLIVTSHQDQKGLMPLLAFLHISIRDAILTLIWIPQALILIIQNSEFFYFRNGVLATNIIYTASAPHQRCQHPTKSAILLAPAMDSQHF